APGDHPRLRHLVRINRPHDFYRQLRGIIFDEVVALDPDDDPREYITEPLPRLREQRFSWRRS
ncbi:MAG: hypothetical protein J0H43_15645, partial [Actinobacteria bacterium]|nr:hypothetical protein [Actinomycetota bacterium]